MPSRSRQWAAPALTDALLQSRDESTTHSCSVPKKKTSIKLHSKNPAQTKKPQLSQKIPHQNPNHWFFQVLCSWQPAWLSFWVSVNNKEKQAGNLQDLNPEDARPTYFTELAPSEGTWGAVTSTLRKAALSLDEHLAAPRRLGWWLCPWQWRLCGTPSPGRGCNCSVHGTVSCELKLTMGCEGRLPASPALSQHENNFQKLCYIPFKLTTIPLKHPHSPSSRPSSSSSTIFHC